MVNEEDHLRFQVMHSGLDLETAWGQINELDDLIEEQVTYAFSNKLGYLTRVSHECWYGATCQRDAAFACTCNHSAN